MRRSWWLGVVLLVAAGCGGSEVPKKLGEVCDEAGQAYCERATECGVIGDIYTVYCEKNFTRGCCGDAGLCEEVVHVSEADWNDCLDAFDVEECPDVQHGNVPPVCASL